MAKRFICNACDTLYDKTHNCKNACSLCTAVSNCTKGIEKYCGTCNRTFASETCFQNHVTLKVQNKLVCQWKRVCRTCSVIVSGSKRHECFKPFCSMCNKHQPTGHLCYMSPLKQTKLSDRFMFVFFYVESTQDLEREN
jgi:hypothetical protein